MNKIITFIATVLSLIMIPYPIKAHAEENRSGFCYTIINGEATVTGFEGTPEIVNIPPTLEECPVTQVRDNAFYKCTSLKEIYLPESITLLGITAFMGAVHSNQSVCQAEFPLSEWAAFRAVPPLNRSNSQQHSLFCLIPAFGTACPSRRYISPSPRQLLKSSALQAASRCKIFTSESKSKVSAAIPFICVTRSKASIFRHL